jgi:hypothetical protein
MIASTSATPCLSSLLIYQLTFDSSVSDNIACFCLFIAVRVKRGRPFKNNRWINAAKARWSKTHTSESILRSQSINQSDYSNNQPQINNQTQLNLSHSSIRQSYIIPSCVSPNHVNNIHLDSEADQSAPTQGSATFSITQSSCLQEQEDDEDAASLLLSLKQ